MTFIPTFPFLSRFELLICFFPPKGASSNIVHCNPLVSTRHFNRLGTGLWGDTLVSAGVFLLQLGKPPPYLV